MVDGQHVHCGGKDPSTGSISGDCFVLSDEDQQLLVQQNAQLSLPGPISRACYGSDGIGAFAMAGGFDGSGFSQRVLRYNPQP